MMNLYCSCSTSTFAQIASTSRHVFTRCDRSASSQVQGRHLPCSEECNSSTRTPVSFHLVLCQSSICSLIWWLEYIFFLSTTGRVGRVAAVETEWHIVEMMSTAQRSTLSMADEPYSKQYIRAMGCEAGDRVRQNDLAPVHRTDEMKSIQISLRPLYIMQVDGIGQ